MTLIERSGELSALEDSLRDKGKVILIHGPAASGKTALLEEFAERRLTAEALLLHAVASRTEQALRFGVIRQLFSCAHTSAASVGNVARLLSDSPPQGIGELPEAYDRVAAGTLEGLWAELLSLSKRQPLVLVVDDVQYADDPSLDCLLYFARRLKAAPIVMVLADGTRPRQSNRLFQAELMRQQHCTGIHLQLLSQRGVARLLAEHLGTSVAHGIAAAAHRASGGNPLLVRALIDDYRATVPKASGELAVGDAFRCAVQSCLNRSDPAMLGLARALAVLDAPASPALLGQLLDIPAESAAEIHTELAGAGLISDSRFAHPAVRAAVLSNMLPQEHASMHSRAAQILHRENAPAEILARHLIAAGTVAGTWAAAVMEEAAEQAIARGDVSHALRCLHFARQLCGSEHERAAVTSKIAEVEWLADPGLAVRNLPYLVRAVNQGMLPGRNAAKVIHYQLWSGKPGEAVSTLGDATGGKPDADTEAELLAMRLWIPALYPGSPGPTAPTAAKSPPLLTSPQLQVALILPELTAGKAPDLAVSLGHMLQTSALDDATLALILTAMSVSAYSGHSELAGPWSETFDSGARLKKSAAFPSQTWRALLAAIRADLNIRAGDLPAAEEQATTAITQISPRSWGVAIGAPLAVLVLAATARGKLDEAADHLNIPVPDAMFLSIFGPLYINARGRYHLAAGKPHFAIRDFETCGELVKHWNMDYPEFVPWRLGAAEAHLRLGARQRASHLLDERPARAETRRSRAHGMSLRLRAAVSPVHGRAPLLREAAELLYEECQDRLEAARAFADLGRTHHALGEHDQARLMQRRAEQLTLLCGAAAHYPAQVGAGIRQTAPRRSPVAARLSGAERRVAALAASGYTNREIASKLFVTTSTVEQHLTRVYRKLKVNRRSDLPPLLRYEAAGSA